MKSYRYDVFLSYAIEDKIELAHELCKKLEQKGLKVWYAGRELIVGNSIETTVREGLERSRFGIVLITPTYFEKKWTLKELYTLMSKENENHKIIIPVFHEITPDEVAIHDKLLSERWALQTTIGLDKLSDEIIARVKSEPSAVETAPNYRSIILSGALLLLLTGLIFQYFQNTSQLSEKLIIEAVESRIENLRTSIENDMAVLVEKENAVPIDLKVVVDITNDFNSLEVQYRNFYEFSNGLLDFQFLKNVQPATGIDFDSWSPVNNYGFKYPNIYSVDRSLNPPYLDKKFIFFNTQPTTYLINKIDGQDSISYVSISYWEPLRLASFHYEYNSRTSGRKHLTYSLKGLMPEEMYIFKKTSDGWSLTNVQ